MITAVTTTTIKLCTLKATQSLYSTTSGGDAPARNEFWFVSGRKYEPFVSTTSGVISLGALGHLTTNT